MISIVTWNTLAQRYVDPYLSTRYPYVSDHSILSWEYRLKSIQQKLTNLNPDIICLQEVELSTIENDFVNFFTEYDCFHHVVSKNRSNPIGNITLWKKSMFTSDKRDNNSCGIFVTLSITGKSEKFQIANIHLKAGLNLGKERIPQINSCIKKMNNDIPHIICGDFNDILENDGLLKTILVSNNYSCHIDENTCSVFNEIFQSSKYWSFDHIATFNTDIEIIPPTINQNIPNVDEPSDHILVHFVLKL